MENLCYMGATHTMQFPFFKTQTIKVFAPKLIKMKKFVHYLCLDSRSTILSLAALFSFCSAETVTSLRLATDSKAPDLPSRSMIWLRRDSTKDWSLCSFSRPVSIWSCNSLILTSLTSNSFSSSRIYKQKESLLFITRTMHINIYSLIVYLFQFRQNYFLRLFI